MEKAKFWHKKRVVWSSFLQVEYVTSNIPFYRSLRSYHRILKDKVLIEGLYRDGFPSLKKISVVDCNERDSWQDKGIYTDYRSWKRRTKRRHQWVPKTH